MRILIFIIFLIFYSCNTSVTEKNEDLKNPKNLGKKEVRIKTDLIDSLVASFDINNYILKTSNLNSGVSNKKYYQYKPDTIGYFYGLYQPYPDYDSVDNPRWFNMAIFKFGKDTENFFKQKDILIEIESFTPDPNLGSLNLIGKSIWPFSDFYKISTQNSDSVNIETIEYSVIMHLTSSKIIDYFKLIRTENINENAP